MKLTEKQIELSIIHVLRLHGFWVQKVHSGALYKQYRDRQGKMRQHKVKLADKGTPDLICCANGKFIAIEVKRDQKEIESWIRNAEKDHRSAAQHHQQELITHAGGIVMVVSSPEETLDHLRQLKLIT